MSLQRCSPGGWDMGACWDPTHVLCSPGCPVQSSCLCCLSWQTWLEAQLVLLGWQPGKVMGRAGRQVTRPGSIHVQQGRGSSRSCRILHGEVMLERCGRSVGEGGGHLAWHE